MMMGEVSLEMSLKNIMIQDMINSENSVNTNESTNTNIFKALHTYLNEFSVATLMERPLVTERSSVVFHNDLS